MILSRRAFPAIATMLTGCFRRLATETTTHLSSRPGEVSSPIEAGTHSLGLRKRRDAILHVPKSADPDRPAPLIVFLHGAGQDEQLGMRRLGAFSDQLGFLLLSPASEDGTWDAIEGSYGHDVRALDWCLARSFEKRRVDPKKIALSGFSDGASYGLGLGLANGDLFGSVLAFSPGFIPSGAAPAGKPRIYVSHGTQDEILPIDSCSRRLVPVLQSAGYSVTFNEFEGPHTVPPQVARAAMNWWLG